MKEIGGEKSSMSNEYTVLDRLEMVAISKCSISYIYGEEKKYETMSFNNFKK